MFQHVLCLCVLYDLSECERTSYDCLIPLLPWNIDIFCKLQHTSSKCETMQTFHRASKHFPCSNKITHCCRWVTCKWVSQGQNSTGPGKIIQPGHLATPLQQTSLHQNTFRCSDRVDQDIEVIWSIWLAEPGDWGHSAKWRGNKVSLCVTAPEPGMPLRKYAANYRQYKNQ